MMKRILILLALFMIPSSFAVAEDGWTKEKEEDGITVYSKKVKGQDLLKFKGVAIIDSPIRVVLGVLIDNDHRTEWVDLLKKSTILKKFSAYDFIVYQHFKTPWPVDDRDMVYRATAYTNAKGSVIIDMNSCKHKSSPATVGVRAKLNDSKYILTPVKRKTKLEVIIQIDLGGWIPDWYINKKTKEWPIKTFKGVRKQVNKDHTRAYALPPKKKKK
ncbi:MAG: START domain-containing protein [Planctomycetota bacterium]|nr:START domain-containing protein [Planctomycetota bacterium]